MIGELDQRIKNRACDQILGKIHQQIAGGKGESADPITIGREPAAEIRLEEIAGYLEAAPCFRLSGVDWAG